MKTVEDFKNAAAKKNITRWLMHDCSLCGYPCGYIFTYDLPKKVLYDSGCDCVNYKAVRESSWESVAKYYNLQDNEVYIQKMNEFWGFK